MNGNILTPQNIDQLKTQKQVQDLLQKKGVNYDTIRARIDYVLELEKLQLELLKLQKWALKQKKRIVIIFEGRDAAGKGGAIRRFNRYLNSRTARIVALGKPSEIEKDQWYFRRHVKELPNAGEMVFFDRSWYNRAVVEPVMGFCTTEDYQQFMQQVPEFEHMLYEDGVKIIKLWFAISNEEQAKRFRSRQNNPLKQWKISPVDLKSRDLWTEYTQHIRQMFVRSHTNFSPWTIIRTNNKKEARLESIRYVLSKFDYTNKDQTALGLLPDPNIVLRFHRSMMDWI